MPQPVQNPADLQEQLGRSIGQVARRWRAELDRRLQPYGLTESRWQILLVLKRAEQPLRQKELAERLFVQGPTLVRSLDSLELEGLVERRPTLDDRRAKTVHLTAKAEPALAQIQEASRSIRAQLFVGIDPEDILHCLTVFSRLAERLEEVALLPSGENPHV
ncbi:MarR family winged helix-turn-helix transcriptional regulator [Saccharospirillum mangrovi]|uniref:MarR family winged helix-turn-helix transcriptional regulator n=1 Tax=Saccharospirillum mangrovi TaxID=2161747 RepID=UPI000D36BC4F|nr:MarR family transcriptional regulator [Saccharospirillum mangrovi]